MQVVSVSSNLTRTAAQQCGRITQVNIHCACILANVTTPNIKRAHGRLGRTIVHQPFYKYHTNPFCTNLSRRAQNSHDMHAHVKSTYNVQTCGTCKVLRLLSVKHALCSSMYLCFTHTAARSLALAGKIQSVRELRLKSIVLFSAKQERL